MFSKDAGRHLWCFRLRGFRYAGFRLPVRHQTNFSALDDLIRDAGSDGDGEPHSSAGRRMVAVIMPTASTWEPP